MNLLIIYIFLNVYYCENWKKISDVIIQQNYSMIILMDNMILWMFIHVVHALQINLCECGMNDNKRIEMEYFIFHEKNIWEKNCHCTTIPRWCIHFIQWWILEFSRSAFLAYFLFWFDLFQILHSSALFNDSIFYELLRKKRYHKLRQHSNWA